MDTPRRTQAQRREQTRKQVLESACRIFGEKGYNNTSLEDIAHDCGVTTRPVYHYFGNKKALFAAVNDLMEGRILEAMGGTEESGSVTPLQSWEGFMGLCDDPGFRQIVLVDSPNVLGRQRWWGESPVTDRAKKGFAASRSGSELRFQIYSRMMIGAFAEAALMIAEAEDIALAKKEATAVVASMFDKA